MLTFRKATVDDLLLYFEWVNDTQVREHSFNSFNITLEDHERWFLNKVEDGTCLMLVFQNEENVNIGQIRIQKTDVSFAIIGISISSEQRNKGYAKEMLKLASDYFLLANPTFQIDAYIKEKNIHSIHAFEKAGFKFYNKIIYANNKSVHYIKTIK